MPTLQDYDWRPVYESRPSEDRSYLVEDFYQPALERATRYDRIAGYFNSGALAAAATGIEAFIHNDAEMRLIVGTQLQTHDRPVLEALVEEFDERFTELEEAELDGRLEILAWLLQHDRLEIKVAEPKRANWGIFHPKVGLFHDVDGNTLSFEGSINETKSGWTLNYERFKVHRSWRQEEVAYLDADQRSFDRLWSDEHDYVDVHPLPEAIEEDLIEWKSPDFGGGIERAEKKATGEIDETLTPDDLATAADYARILREGGLMPGGLHIAEEAATIDPWPHQRVVSDTAVSTYPQGFLFCDEVGLGKTIEIGLTLSRLAHTQEIQNSLLLVPAGLTQQWQSELWEKFNLRAYRYDRQQDGTHAFVDPWGQPHQPPEEEELFLDPNRQDEPWVESPIWRFVHDRQSRDEPALIIQSWHTARLGDYWSDLAPGAGPGGRTNGSVPASIRGRSAERREGVWDAVVVDEAHNARRTTNLYRLLEELRPHTQTFYMLTATPMQLHHGELYDLLTLLGLPAAWDDRNDFEQFFQTRRALRSQLRSDADTDPITEIETQQTLDGNYQSGLGSSRSASKAVYHGVRSELDLEDEAMARGRLFDACRLARAYGGAYDGYADLVDSELAAAEFDPFSGEEKAVKQLLYTEAQQSREPWIVGRNDRYTALDELSEQGWAVVAAVLEEATPVSALLHRNTRDTLRKYHQAGILDETVADRNPERKDIPLTGHATDVYDRIDEYTKRFYKKAQEMETQALGFVMTTYRQRLTSSVAAITESLSKRLETLEQQRDAIERAADVEASLGGTVSLENVSADEQLELAELENAGEEVIGVDVAEVMPGDPEVGLDLIEEEIQELRSFIDDVREIGLDPKIQQLQADLRELDREGHNRILIFTQYTDTMDYVRSHLEGTFGENVATYSGRGGEMFDADRDEWYGVSKEAVKRAFALEDAGIDVLIGTEAASEGLNLQECGAVINYDLPWNPMKVEQRIGRVDRIGQEHDEITIYHYIYEDTIENDIYDALDERIGMFEDVVGDLQPILAGVNQQIKSATLEGEDSENVSESLESDLSEADTGGDTVEVRDALGDVGVDAAERQTVLENARLGAWESFKHPDIDTIGSDEHDRLPFTTEGVGEAIRRSILPGMDDIGIYPVEAGADVVAETELDGTDLNAIYRVELSSDWDIRPPEQETIADRLRGQDGEVIVTFDPEIANEYPSIRFLQPGDPIYSNIVTLVERVGDLALDWERLGTGDGDSTVCSPGETPPVVQGSVDSGGKILNLSDEGRIQEIDSNGFTLSDYCMSYQDWSDRRK